MEKKRHALDQTISETTLRVSLWCAQLLTFHGEGTTTPPPATATTPTHWRRTSRCHVTMH